MYTLPVIDDSGEITGKKGTILVSSRVIILSLNIEKIPIGQAILPSHTKGLLPGKGYKTPATPYRLRDGREFQIIVCTYEPREHIKKEYAVFAWERIK